jgi:hypothetical protein
MWIADSLNHSSPLAMMAQVGIALAQADKFSDPQYGRMG